MIISYLGGKLTHRFCLVCRQKVSKYFQQITSVMWDHAKDVSKRLTNHKEIRNDIKPKNRNYMRILVFLPAMQAKYFLQHAHDQKIGTNHLSCYWLRLS